jgi:para-aminobenzoate synthetase / 4-amino-4-deoxychorismate lyase
MHSELLAEGAGLAQVARALRDDRRPFVLAGRWLGDEQDVIAGSEPVRVLRAGEDPFAALDDVPAVPGADDGRVAFGGGWVGLLGAALADRVERLPPSPPPRGAVSPPHRLAYYDHVVRLTRGGRCVLEALVTGDERRAELRARAAELRRRLAAPAEAQPWHAGPLRVLAPGTAGHEEAVASVVERIATGEVFQVNLSLRLAGRLEGSPLDAWLDLMQRAPAAYGAYLGWEGGALLSASPELFLRRTGALVRASPMKGTRPRLAGDDAGARELAAAAKDAAENVMIVDLMRNDLGRVCAYGSVTASAPEVQPHPGVWQLVAHVDGRLRPGTGDGDLLRATFPPGSVVGAPKVQALKVIAAEEATARGAHCGAIGFASPVAGLGLNVAIRTFEVSGSELALGVGGGVVSDSTPAGEHQECLDKAAPLAAALRTRVLADPPEGAGRSVLPALLDGAAGRPDPWLGLLETVAVRDRAPVALDAHLARLVASARAVLGAEIDVEAAARAARAAAAEGAAALRITVTPQAACPPRLEIAPRPLADRDPDRPVALEPVLLPGGLGAHKWLDRRLLAPRPSGATALLCDRGGEVLEAAWANVWIAEDGVLLTPPADGRLLPGIARAAVLAAPAAHGYPAAREERLGLERLRAADAVLLTSALTGGLRPAALGLLAGRA